MSQENVEIVRTVDERFSEGDFRASADLRSQLGLIDHQARG
jgi:hypothetical protein